MGLLIALALLELLTTSIVLAQSSLFRLLAGLLLVRLLGPSLNLGLLPRLLWRLLLAHPLMWWLLSDLLRRLLSHLLGGRLLLRLRLWWLLSHRLLWLLGHPLLRGLLDGLALGRPWALTTGTGLSCRLWRLLGLTGLLGLAGRGLWCPLTNLRTTLTEVRRHGEPDVGEGHVLIVGLLDLLRVLLGELGDVLPLLGREELARVRVAVVQRPLTGLVGRSVLSWLLWIL